MIKNIYARAMAVLAKKPIRLWGISLLYTVLSAYLGLLGGAVPIIGICLTVPASVGMLLVYLHGYRGEQVYTTQLLEIFEKKDDTLKRVVVGSLWKDLWILIWCLIPIVGPIFAIIKSYQYRLTPYILANEPDVKPTDAIKVSKQRTEGYCGSMFGADFLPYVIIFVVVLILLLFSRIKYIGVLFGIILFAFVALVFLFLPLFLGLVHAAFYEEINNPSMTATGAALVNCPNCGAAVEEGAAFCPSCGFRMTPDEAAQNIETPVQNAEAPTEANTEVPPEEAPKNEE